MANTLNLGSGNWGAKDSLLLGYYEDGGKFFPETFDVTRATGGTRVNKAGLIETPTEIGSEEVANGDFSNGSTDWSEGSSTTISIGEASFNGVSSYVYQDILTIGKTYTCSVSVKDWVSGAAFSVGSSASGSGTIYSNITRQSNTTTTFIFTAVSTILGIGSRSFDIVGSIDNVSVKEYNDKNLARIDYLDDANGVLLTEPQSTNLIQYSESFDNAYWTKSGASVVGGFTSPSADTPLGAFNMVEDTSNGRHRLKAIGINTVANRYNFSVFVKPNGRNEIRIIGSNYFSSGTDAYFNLETKVITYGARAENGLIETLANGWFRCSFSSSGGEYAGNNAYMNIETALNNSNSYQGDGTSGIYIFGASLEALSYSTSYIKTEGSTVTRNGDQVNGAGDATTFNDSEGVLMVEISALANDGASRQISLSSGSSATNKVSLLYTSTSNQVQAFIRASGSISFNVTQTLSDVTNSNKILVKYKLNDFAFWVNGFEVATDTSGNTPTGLNVLDFDDADGTSDFYGNTKQLQYFNTALTDIELETLTSWTSFILMANAQNYTIE